MAESLPPPHEAEKLLSVPRGTEGSCSAQDPGNRAKNYSTQNSGLSEVPLIPPPSPPRPAPAGNNKEEIPKQYISPFQRYLNQLEFWKFFSAVLAIFALGATLHNNRSISRQCMIAVAALLVAAIFAFIVAHDLQERHPRIADGGMIVGVASLVSSFHIIALAFLDLRVELLIPTIFFLVILYSSLVVYLFYPIIIRDVHKEEKNEEDV